MFRLIYSFILLTTLVGCQQNDDLPSVLYVEVVGESYVWKTRYAGLDNELNTKDDLILDGDIYLPENQEVVLKLTSKDNIYFWIIEELGVKGIALENRVEELIFNTDDVGIYPIEADPMCGFTHESLHIQLQVIEREEFYKKFISPISNE